MSLQRHLRIRPSRMAIVALLIMGGDACYTDLKPPTDASSSSRDGGQSDVPMGQGDGAQPDIPLKFDGVAGTGGSASEGGASGSFGGTGGNTDVPDSGVFIDSAPTCPAG